MSESVKKVHGGRPAPQLFRHQVQHRPILPPPNQTSLRPVIPEHPTDVTLPMPSSHLYRDNYHHPWFPAILPPINRFVTPEHHPFRFPQPLGPLPAHHYNFLGVTMHDFNYVNDHPDKSFTKWLLWYLEISDHLLQCICPADLNDMPCEWDELQGGCRMLRLCSARMKYEHPHLGELPRCTPATRYNCMYVHDIEPTCRSIAKQLTLPTEEGIEPFKSWQRCAVVARGEICWWGHDFESARVVSAYDYWTHRNEARVNGSAGVVKKTHDGLKIWKPLRPEAKVAGTTFHGLKPSYYAENLGKQELEINPELLLYQNTFGYEERKRRFPDSGYTSEAA